MGLKYMKMGGASKLLQEPSSAAKPKFGVRSRPGRVRTGPLRTSECNSACERAAGGAKIRANPGLRSELRRHVGCEPLRTAVRFYDPPDRALESTSPAGPLDIRPDETTHPCCIASHLCSWQAFLVKSISLCGPWSERGPREPTTIAANWRGRFQGI